MKQTLKIVTLASFLLCSYSMVTLFGVLNKQKHYYPHEGIVTSVEADTVVVQDFNGHKWVFMGAEDWQVNDICAMIMDSNGTDEIFDDEIVKIKYCGYMEG